MKKLTFTFLLILGFIAAGQHAFAAQVDVYGYACSQNIGCFSLNSVSSAGQTGYVAQPAPFAVKYDDVANRFSGGKGWSPIIGDINFGVQCPASMSGISGSQTGNKCARAALAASSITASSGWDGYIYMGDVHSAPGTGTFTGRGWEGTDVDNSGVSSQIYSDVGIGWINFINAYIDVPLTCGPSSEQTFYATPTDELCSDGSTPAVTFYPPDTFGWTCGTDTCQAIYVPVACGAANGTVVTSQPIANLCDDGSAATVTGPDGNGNYNWTCGTSPCSASTSIMCGSANGSITNGAPTTNLCSNNSTPAVTGPNANGLYSWSCGTNPCQATDSNYPACDPIATGVPTTVLPANLCATPSIVSSGPIGSNPWSWTCANPNNASQTVSCSTITPGIHCGSTAGTCTPALTTTASTVGTNGQWTCTENINPANVITCGGHPGPLHPSYIEN